MEYTSQGQGALNTVLGAIGTYGALANGSLGGILGGLGGNTNNNSDHDTVIDLKTENAILKSEIDVSTKIATLKEELCGQIRTLDSKVDSVAATQAVWNCSTSSSVAVLQNQVAQLMGMTKLSIPNSAVCPGWGTVTVSNGSGTTTTT